MQVMIIIGLPITIFYFIRGKIYVNEVLKNICGISKIKPSKLISLVGKPLITW